MEESEKKEHANNNENVTETSLYHEKKGKRNPPIYHTPIYDGRM